MKKCLVIALGLTLLALQLRAGDLRIRGQVTEAETGKGIVGAVVRLDREYLWALTDLDGHYVINGAEPGTYTLTVSCLGYADATRTLPLQKSLDGVDFALQVESLALEEVVVTARLDKDNLNTTQTIGRTALDHMQLSGLSNIAALLPGGKTVNPDLTQSQELSIRGGGVGAGNQAFATAVEVNGVRMGDNASFGGLAGVDTRSLPVENVESVEVISGVPSAEYGDLGSGLVKVNTKKGRTPVNVTFSVNPRTYDASVSKGLLLPGGGTLNLSGQWTRATQKLTSPYTSYTRRGFTAEYNQTIARQLRVEAGITGNIGGMNAKEDPDSFSEEYSQARDNVLAPHVKAVWLLNRSWVTNLSLEASLYYHDKRTHEHLYNSYASTQPAVHSTQQGYWLADALPLTFYADRITDSRELDYAASLKYDWLHHFGPVKNTLKAGLQWTADGNVGQGEYYEDPALAANGYRPRPYSDYPYMHNLAFYAEERAEIPLGSTRLEATAGLRLETLLLSGARYNNLRSLSPRLNLRWSLGPHWLLRGGWGITRKMPGFYVLYPEQQYRDILSFGYSYPGGSSYIYYTQPFTLTTNPDLRWQTSRNAEVAVEFTGGGFQLSLTAFRNLTLDPYEYTNAYTPFTYNIYQLPVGFGVTAQSELRVDHQTGEAFLRDAEGYFTPMDLRVQDRSFVNSRMARGGATVTRTGLELTADFPEIPALRTRLRLDAAYTATEYRDTQRSYFYNAGWSHTREANRSYQYVGIYEGDHSVIQGRQTHYLDANLTTITHIPAVRLIITCRIEATLLRYARNLSSRAFTVSEDSLTPTSADIYAGNSYTAVYPVAYLDLEGVEHAWQEADAQNPDLQRLIVRSGNVYTFAADGYDPYVSANLSITKEIGKHVSLSLFANNFTNARPYRKSYATGVSAVFTPAFYYGLTCRIKL